jgi:hypothetical protein
MNWFTTNHSFLIITNYHTKSFQFAWKIFILHMLAISHFVWKTLRSLLHDISIMSFNSSVDLNCLTQSTKFPGMRSKPSRSRPSDLNENHSRSDNQIHSCLKQPIPQINQMKFIKLCSHDHQWTDWRVSNSVFWSDFIHWNSWIRLNLWYFMICADRNRESEDSNSDHIRDQNQTFSLPMKVRETR